MATITPEKLIAQLGRIEPEITQQVPDAHAMGCMQGACSIKPQRSPQGRGR